MCVAFCFVFVFVFLVSLLWERILGSWQVGDRWSGCTYG
jgi:hypothetical protein